VSEHGEWPIVVGGCHRSGTSLLRRMLNAHPDIHCAPEVTFFRDFFGEFRDDPLRHLRFATTVRELVPEDGALEVLGRAFVELHERAARAARKRRWADKSPDNVLHAGRWDALLGGRMLFVQVVRDPLDTVASMRGRFPLSLPADVPGLAEHWSRYTDAGLEFVSAHADRSAVVAYEDLCRSPRPTLRHLMSFLGAQLDPAQLEFNRVRQPTGLEDPNVALTEAAHTRSIGRWARDLSAEEAELVRGGTGSLWAVAQDAAARDRGRPAEAARSRW
jgi:hypothetical protein